MKSQGLELSDSITKNHDDIIHIESQKLAKCLLKTPKRSNFERIEPNFEAKIQGNYGKEFEKTGKSPGLIKLMQKYKKKLPQRDVSQVDVCLIYIMLSQNLD